MAFASEGTRERRSAHGDVIVRHLGNGLGVWTSGAPSSSGGVAVGLHVAVGSLYESEEERGLSHLLEHLAFRGGHHFPPGALERFFDLHGTRLGRHHNATTSLEETCFSLSFPEYAPETLDRAVACLADFAFGMDLDTVKVDQERRVVLEEMRGHEDARSRVRRRLLDLVFPGSLFALRHPLGAREVIETVTAHELGAYYRRWYRPETCTIAAAGQVTEEEVAEAVDRHFGSWHSEGAPPAAPDPGILSAANGVCDVITDPGTVETSARLVKALCQEPPRNRDQRIEHTLQEVAIRLLGRRLGELALDASGPVRNVRITRSPLACSWHLIGLVAATTSHGAVEAAGALARELRRISDHGFDDSEAESAAQLLRNDARRVLRREKHRPVLAVLNELLDAVSSNEPPLSAEQRSRILADVSERMEPVAMRDTLMSILTPSEVAAAVVVPTGGAVQPSTEQLYEAMQRAVSAPTSAPVHYPRLQRLMDRPPPPGVITNRDVHHELGIHTLTLENGIVVHIRPMEDETDLAIVQLTLAGGRILETVDDVGLTAGAAVAFANPAFSGVPSRVIRNRLAETTISPSCFVDEDVVTLRAASDPEDLEHSFQLLHLLLSRSRVEHGALRRWQAGFQGYAAGRPLGIESQLAQTSLRLLTGDDHRFRLLTHERAEAISVDAAQHWLDRELLTAPLEAAVVGAVDLDRVAEYALRYLGALPVRPEHDPRLAKLRRIAAPRGPVTEVVDTAASASRAALTVAWRTSPWNDAERRQPLHMAAHILAQRIHNEIRQSGGLSYDVNCSYSPSRAYPGVSMLAVTLYTPPRRADEAAEAVRVLVEGFADDGPDEREMESVRLLFADLATRAQREPRFWARVLSELRYRDGKLSDLTGLPDRCLQRTAEQVHRAAAGSIRPDHRLTVICRPPE